jgi:hypothetical protein
MRSIVAWSRIFADHEVIAAVNTDPLLPQTAWVTVDAGLHPDGATMTCRYSTVRAQENATVPVENRNGRAVRLTVPPAGFVVYD